MVNKSISGPATAYIAEQFRAQKGRLLLSVRDIEVATGLGRSVIDRAIRGESTMAVETFLAICKALDLDSAKLIKEAEESTLTIVSSECIDRLGIPA